MDEVCELTELIKGHCAHCRNVPDPIPKRRSVTPTTTAQWPGFCARCGEEFASGERIRSDGAGGWIAECCGGDDD